MGVLKEHYLGDLSLVDGVATYLKLPLRTNLHKDFHSTTIRYNPTLEHTLSAEEKQAIATSDEHISCSSKIHKLTKKITYTLEVDNVGYL